MKPARLCQSWVRSSQTTNQGFHPHRHTLSRVADTKEIAHHEEAENDSARKTQLRSLRNDSRTIRERRRAGERKGGGAPEGAAVRTRTTGAPARNALSDLDPHRAERSEIAVANANPLRESTGKSNVRSAIIGTRANVGSNPSDPSDVAQTAEKKTEGENEREIRTIDTTNVHDRLSTPSAINRRRRTAGARTDRTAAAAAGPSPTTAEAEAMENEVSPPRQVSQWICTHVQNPESHLCSASL